MSQPSQPNNKLNLFQQKNAGGDENRKNGRKRSVLSGTGRQMGVGTFWEVVAIFIVAPFSAAAVVAVVVAVVDVHQVVGKDDFAVVHAVLSAPGANEKK